MRAKAYVVVLEHDLKDDEAELVLNAIARFRGVLSVKAVPSDDALTDMIAAERVRAELGRKLVEVVFPRKEEGR